MAWLSMPAGQRSFALAPGPTCRSLNTAKQIDRKLHSKNQRFLQVNVRDNQLGGTPPVPCKSGNISLDHDATDTPALENPHRFRAVRVTNYKCGSAFINGFQAFC